LPGAGELDHVDTVVISLDQSRQRAALTECGEIGGRHDLRKHGLSVVVLPGLTLPTESA
jgi:hypothetical protein